MKTQVIVLLLCICFSQMIYTQEAGVVSLSLPIRNSLTFNRYTINPTFSFVREQHKYISLFNKREFVQFEDAPLTYLASFTGRFEENIGAGVGVFQQNYGVLTTFGGILNFAYNARLARESNLTFGLNVGAFKSGLNSGNVVANLDDPALQTIPDNFLLTINPGINYGLAFLDFGISLNNLAVYSFESSQLIQDLPEQAIQAHMMYTGYMNSQGFFDESKFSGLIKSEFQKEETIVSAMVMLTVPKGIWAQAGYNSLYGASGGVGINITSQIAIEYNFEKALGELTDFGPSHDITLAYRFKRNNYFDYSGGEEISGLISTEKKVQPLSKAAKEKAEANRKLAEERRAETRRLAEQKAEEEAAEKAMALSEQKVKEEAEAQARLAEQKAKEEADAQARLAEQKAEEEAEAKARLLAEQKAEEEAEAQARLAEQRAKAVAAAEEARLLAEQKAKAEAEAKAKALADHKAKEEAESQEKLLAEQKAQEEAEAKLLEEQNALEQRISNPEDEMGKAMYALTQQAEDSKTKQDDLLNQFDEIVAIKNQDLKDLKEENDLSDKGIAVELKPFKSISEENARLEAIIAELDEVIRSRSEEIEELKKLYEEKYDEEVGTIYLDEVYVYYKRTLDRLKAEQIAATQAKIRLQLKLEDIRVATEFEKNRRIKRAAFDNEEERYENDRATLQNIKQITRIGEQSYTAEDFDFGEERSNNIQILKNMSRVENGYYLIMAVHNDTEKRNDFVTKVVASGETNVDFFYDESTSKYYVFSKKFDSIDAASEAMTTINDKPYNAKTSLVKIEN